MKYKKEIYKKIQKYWYLFPLIILFLIFAKKILFMATIIFIILSALLVGAYRLIIPYNIGLELITFYSVILTYNYGALVGSIFAIILITISHTISKNFCVFLLIKCLVYIAICVLASLILPLGLIVTGIICAIMRNVLLLGVTFFMNPNRVWADLPGAIINSIINIWLFFNFGQVFLNLL